MIGVTGWSDARERRVGDEKLLAIGVSATICHRYLVAVTVGQAAIKFIRENLARSAGPGWVASLDHEIRDQPEET